MTTDTYTLSQFVTDLRQLTSESQDEKSLLAKVRPLAKRAALSPDWREERHYKGDTEQGFGITVLHDEPDHSLFIIAVSWLPGRGAPAHDHGSWAVIVGVDGPEKILSGSAPTTAHVPVTQTCTKSARRFSIRAMWWRCRPGPSIRW